MRLPRDVLTGEHSGAGWLPVCDHYCGVQLRMEKSLQLQSEMSQEFGTCVFDVTLDCEDGAPVGGERDHAQMVAAIAIRSQTASQNRATRVAARVHPVAHPAFDQDVQIIAGAAGAYLSHLMLPKVESLADVERAVVAVDQAVAGCGRAQPLPLHVLIESSAAVHRAFEIAAHPRVESLSFGLMDFVSAHGGAIPASAMTVAEHAAPGVWDQLSHPLVLRAKLDVSAACHASGKTASHGVVTEFGDARRLDRAARMACQALGYTRMWSIHPGQIRPILAAFAPGLAEVELAIRIIDAAVRADWAPTAIDGKLHDRASYRYFWQVLQRAHQTGVPLAAHCAAYFGDVTP